jgi:hypothetical protein
MVDIMTAGIFFWYVLPLIIAAAAFAWTRYDRSKKHRHHLHPGE